MKKTLALVLAAVMIISLAVPFISFTATAEAVTATSTPTKISVNWNYGYMGSSVNTSYSNKLSGGSATSTYRVSDVITIAEKGTTIYFNDVSGFSSYNAYIFSSWTNSNGSWIFDPYGANYYGNSGNASTIQIKESNNSITYSYTTSLDNENLRLCYCCTGNKDGSGNDVYPDVYVVKNGGTAHDNVVSNLTFETNGTVSGVTWQSGYVGSDTNAQGCVGLLRRDAGSYTYSDIITVPKKGTKISFTDSASPFSAASAYAISSWIQDETGKWILDTDGANYNGVSTDIVTGDTAKTYTYITYKDNETLRFCYQSAATAGTLPESFPTVNWEATTEPSTFTPSEPADSITVNWNRGKAVISPHNAYGYSNWYESASTYCSTDVFTVPNAGTKLTWTDPSSSYASNSVCTVSTWKNVNGNWEIDLDGPLFVGNGGAKAGIVESASSASGVTYTYVTTSDNENLRLCVLCTDGQTLPTVEFSTTSEAGTWTKAQTLFPDFPGTPVSNLTGAELDSTKLGELKWKYGYVGSDTNASGVIDKIKVGSSNYLYSDVFTVPKAGTVVYFYDSNAADGGGTIHASSNAYIFSHWKKQGSEWVVDTTKDNIDGGEVSQRISGDYTLYWYITTEDNENLRICYAGAQTDLNISAVMSEIYFVGSPELIPVTATGTLTDASYKNSNGDTVNYKIYLPNGFDSTKNYKAVFSIGSDTAIADALVAAGTDAVIVTFDGTAHAAELLIDAVVEGYSLNRYFLYLTGSSEVNTDCGKIFVNYAANATGFDSALAAGNDLLAKEPDFYGVLNEITLYAIGDSYFGGTGIGKAATWVNHMGDKYKMDYVNYGIGGSTVSNFVTNKNPMVDRYSDMASGDADVILLEGGRNDRTNVVPLGTNDSKDSKTFLGALNIMIDGFLEKYPNAIIILVTPWYNTDVVAATGYTNVTYANAMKGLAEYRNNPRIICLNAADRTAIGVNMDDAAFRAKYCISPTDVSHLNIEGMDLIQPYMEDFIAKALAEYRGLNIDGTDPNETTAGTDTTAGPNDTTVPGSTTTATDNSSGGSSDDSGCAGCSGFTVFAQLTALLCAGFVLVIVRKKH